MAQRGASSVQFVQFPFRDAASFVALAIALEGAVEGALAAATSARDKGAHKPAKGKRPAKLPPVVLPETVGEALGDVKSGRAALQKLIAPKQTTPSRALAEADADEDDVVVAMRDILRGWARLARLLPLAQSAGDALREIFGDKADASFVRIAPPLERAQVETRLGTIRTADVGKKLDAIGMKPVVALLEKVHARYSKVIDDEGGNVVESPKVRAAREVLREQLATYILAVVASPTKANAWSTTLANALVKPYRTWKPAERTAKKGKGTKGGAPGRTTPPTTPMEKDK